MTSHFSIYRSSSPWEIVQLERSSLILGSLVIERTDQTENGNHEPLVALFEVPARCMQGYPYLPPAAKADLV